MFPAFSGIQVPRKFRRTAELNSPQVPARVRGMDAPSQHEDFKHPGEMVLRNFTGQAGIHRVFRGLKSDSDPREIGLAFHSAGTEIWKKGCFAKVSRSKS